jgi:hypothetical protein
MRDPFRSVICDSVEGLYGADSVQTPEWAWSTRQKTQSGFPGTRLATERRQITYCGNSCSRTDGEFQSADEITHNTVSRELAERNDAVRLGANDSSRGDGEERSMEASNWTSDQRPVSSHFRAIRGLQRVRNRSRQESGIPELGTPPRVGIVCPPVYAPRQLVSASWKAFKARILTSHLEPVSLRQLHDL